MGKELCQLETKGWVVHPHLWAGYNRNSKYFQIRDPQGFVLEFQIQGNKGVLKTASYGCSNLRGERPSSSADIRNIQFLVEGDWVKVTWSDGLTRYYLRSRLGIYRLEKEMLSNGKTIRYEYDFQGLCKIASSDPTGQLIYATITRVGNNHYVGSDGREVNLVYELREVKGKYKKKHYEQKLRFQFPVMIRGSNPSYVNTVGYNDRTLLNTTHWTYTPGNLTLSKQKPDGTIVVNRYNEQLLPEKIGSREFRYDQLDRLVGGAGFSRTLDPFGNILREEWSNALWIETDYDELDRPLIRRLPDHSRIEYEYYGLFLKKVSRFSSKGDELYSHSYDDYDAKGNPRIENGLFETNYEYNKRGKRISQKNSYYSESIEYNPSGNLVRKGNITYTYDPFITDDLGVWQIYSLL